MGIFATMGLKYMREYGCREEHAALARVIMADNARRNPHAHLKLELTIEDVLKSRVLVWPVRLLHMSPTSCGACALILAKHPELTPFQLKNVLYLTATNVGGGD